VRRIAIAALCAVLCAPAGAVRAQRAPAPVPRDEGPGPEAALTQRIVVWRIDALGIKAELVGRLETLFRSELDRLAKHPLPARRDLERMVGKDRKLRDCSGEDKCLAAIGTKIGVDVVIAGSVAALGDNYILDIKAVDAKTGKQIRRIQSDPLRGSPDELIEAVRVAAYSLLAPEQLYGSVYVLSDLVGAKVSLDGKSAGKTPLPGPIAKQPLGKHVLKVEAPGYLPFEDEVEVRFQKSTRVVVRLATREPVETGPARTVEREPGPWWTSKWAYVGAGALAITIGAVIGWQLGKDEVIDCTVAMPDPRCSE